MTFGMFDDGTPSHPKLLRAKAEAGWLWFCSILYSNKHHLDGRIAKDVLENVYPPLGKKAFKLAEKLCEVRLWHDRGDHFAIHDYDNYQDVALKDDVEAIRAYERDRKRASRRKARGLPAEVPASVPDNVPDVPWDCPDDVPSAVPSRGQAPGRVRDPGPSLPVPTNPDPDVLRVDAPLTPERDVDEPDPPDWRTTRDLVRKRFSDAYKAARGDDPTWTPGNLRAAVTVADWLDKRNGDPERILALTLENFFADEFVKSRAFPIALLAPEPGKFWKPPPELGPKRRGFVPPSTSYPNAPKSEAELEAVLNRKFGPAPVNGGKR